VGEMGSRKEHINCYELALMFGYILCLEVYLLFLCLQFRAFASSSRAFPGGQIGALNENTSKVLGGSKWGRRFY